jgi:hypothetical protein
MIFWRLIEGSTQANDPLVMNTSVHVTFGMEREGKQKIGGGLLLFNGFCGPVNFRGLLLLSVYRERRLD